MKRLRVTTHLPFFTTRIGLTIWWGSVETGWTGKQVAPWLWSRTWHVSGVDPAEVEARAAGEGDTRP